MKRNVGIGLGLVAVVIGGGFLFTRPVEREQVPLKKVEETQKVVPLSEGITQDPLLQGEDYDVRMDDQGNFLTLKVTALERSVYQEANTRLRKALEELQPPQAAEGPLAPGAMGAFEQARITAEKEVYAGVAKEQGLPDARIVALIATKVNRALSAYFQQVQALKSEELAKLEQNPNPSFSKAQTELLAEDLARKKGEQLTGLSQKEADELTRMVGLR